MKDMIYNGKNPVARDEESERLTGVADGSLVSCKGNNNIIILGSGCNVNTCFSAEAVLKLLDIIRSQQDEISRLNNLISKYHGAKH